MSIPRGRFSDYINSAQVREYSPITVIGAGGIGSRVAKILAQIGFDLTLFDHDTVGPENIGAQEFGFYDIGKLKVEALKIMLEKDFKVSVKAIPEKFKDQEESLSRIVVCGVDSKEVRKEIWDNTINLNPLVDLFMDGRVGGNRFKVFSLNPTDQEKVKKYETQLDLSRKSKVAPCTGKFTPEAGLAIAMYMWTNIRSHVNGKNVPFLIAGADYDLRIIN